MIPYHSVSRLSLISHGNPGHAETGDEIEDIEG